MGFTYRRKGLLWRKLKSRLELADLPKATPLIFNWGLPSQDHRHMSFAPLPASRRDPHRRQHHGILPSRALHPHRDWGEHALQRTWRTVGAICMLLSIGNAFIAKLPAVLFMLTGIWAHLKGNPSLRGQLSAHPVIGAPLRWWMNRGRHMQPQTAPDTTPQM